MCLKVAVCRVVLFVRHCCRALLFVVFGPCSAQHRRGGAWYGRFRLAGFTASGYHSAHYRTGPVDVYDVAWVCVCLFVCFHSGDGASFFFRGGGYLRRGFLGNIAAAGVLCAFSEPFFNSRSSRRSIDRSTFENIAPRYFRVHTGAKFWPPKMWVNPLRTAVPFWGQTTSNLSGLSPKRDCCSTKRVINNTVTHGS